jgi:NADP-dependent 3-hydroxy acid dehydrogenase YdfG
MSTSGAVEAAKCHGSGLDVLVNTAGSGYTTPILDVDLDLAHPVYDTNIWSVLGMMQGLQQIRCQGYQ